MYARQVLVVEDESLLRDLIAKMLEAAGFQVTTAANAADAKRAFEAVDPDAAVIDVELGAGPNGFDFASAVHEVAPDVGLVFLTNLPDPRFVGRHSDDLPKHVAYLRKSQLVDAADLVNAIEAVLRDSVTKAYRHDLDATRPLAELSRKQISVLHLLAMGYSNAQIAEKRSTTIRAVEGIVSRTFAALNVDPQAAGNARVEAAAKFLQASGKAMQSANE